MEIRKISKILVYVDQWCADILGIQNIHKKIY